MISLGKEKLIRDLRVVQYFCLIEREIDGIEKILQILVARVALI
jgi:hypothetical protein